VTKFEIIQGVTAHYYHVLPSELSRVTISPEREAIFQYLSRLGSDRFVDFITDVLVEVEKHNLVDRTDGPGDEKQDILTLDSAGQRHLTQCKHTINYGNNTSGDDLDHLMPACLRKNCRNALYVTNADLTVQAKRYVTDKEYSRGWCGPEDLLPSIDYWNGRRIWDRVSKSNTILNKWFSGMAQAHALRRFFTDVVITQMPMGDSCSLDAEAITKELKRTYKVIAIPESKSFDVVVDESLTLNLSDWFRGSAELGVPFILPADIYKHPNVPLRSIRVQALLSENAGAFDIASRRDRIARLIGTALPNLKKEAWWHVLVAPPQAFVFLQDMEKAVLITVDEPETYISVGNQATFRERTWAVSASEGFTRTYNPDDPDDEAWLHKATETTLRILVEQEINPLSMYELHLRQSQIVDELRTHTFRAVKNADATVIDTIRRISNTKWFVLQSSAGDLLWAYPPDAEKDTIEKFERVIKRRGIKVLSVQDKDRNAILKMIDTTPYDFGGMLVMGEHALTTPVALDRRTFWFSREHKLQTKISMNQMLEILKYKSTYEAKHGHDLLAGKTKQVFAYEELGRILFDPITFRGRRMVDVGFYNGKMSINLRIRDGLILSADELARAYIKDFKGVCSEVLRRLHPETK